MNPPSTPPPSATTARSAASAASAVPTGAVAFVGTGPGDPGLLTLRAAEVLAAADVVVLDRFAPRDVVARHCREDVEVVETDGGECAPGAVGGVGPSGATEALTTAARARLVTAPAKAGRRVVRLFAGDGAARSELAEEMLAAARAHLPFEVVPGVSAASAIPVYAGVATATSRVSDLHVLDADLGTAGLDAMAAVPGTVVLTGGHDELVTAAKSLVAAGRPEGREVTVISGGTTTAQRTVSATLGTLSAVLSEVGEALPEPLVAVIGPGTAARERLAWFETRALFGWRVLVPRTQAQSTPTVERLATHGATADVVPTIAVEPPRTPHQMDKAVRGLVTGRYEWVGFTSVNAVAAVRAKFAEYGLDARAFSGLKVAAVGGTTAQALRDWGIEPDLVPSGEESAAGLLADWPPYDEVLDPIDRVFLPRADIATESLVEGLQAAGWQVDDVTAYRTVRAAPPPAPVRDAIKSGAFDAVVFTSSSTVRNLVGIAGKPHPATVVAVIGPATAAAAEELGLRVDVVAAEASGAALVDALAAHGTALRAGAEAAGEPVLRPSERRTGVGTRRRSR